MMNEAVVRFDSAKVAHTISPFVHGQFVEHLGKCVHGGIWVGRESRIANEEGIRRDVLGALRDLEIPVLRWPGGCFADQYRWRDGIGAPEERPARRNIHWRQAETNAFGTEEYMRLCRLLDTEPYVALNVGSGSVQEAADWVEYCNCDSPTALTRLREANGGSQPHNVRYWGVGNETWGCGGNMTAEQYANLYAQYATFLRATDPSIRLIACGSHCDLEWDHHVLARLGQRLHLADYLSVHCYSGRRLSDRDGAPAKLLRLWSDLVAKERFLRQILALLDSHNTEKHRVGLILDEWGTWYDEAAVENGLAMANTLCDALFAAASLHLFHSLGEGLFMANLAQTVNVLQCLVHTEGEQCAKTATYFAFDLLRPHQGGKRIAFEVSSPNLGLNAGAIAQLSASISRDGEGRLYASLINRSPTKALRVRLVDASGEPAPIEGGRLLRSQSLAGENYFDRPRHVAPRALSQSQSRPPIRLPAASIVGGYVAR